MAAYNKTRKLLEQFRGLREKSELWIYQAQSQDSAESARCQDILEQLIEFCTSEPNNEGGAESSRVLANNQTLLFNLNAHLEVIEFLRLRFEEKSPIMTTLFSKCYFFLQQVALFFLFFFFFFSQLSALTVLQNQ